VYLKVGTEGQRQYNSVSSYDAKRPHRNNCNLRPGPFHSNRVVAGDQIEIDNKHGTDSSVKPGSGSNTVSKFYDAFSGFNDIFSGFVDKFSQFRDAKFEGIR